MSLETNPFGPRHRVVGPELWVETITDLRDQGYTYFDWLSAVDEFPDGFRIVVHIAKLRNPGLADHLLVATLIPRDDPRIASLTEAFAGAAWHERARARRRRQRPR